MKRTHRGTLATLGWLMAAATAHAQPPATPVQPSLDRRVSVDVNTVPAATVLHQLADSIGSRLQIDPRVEAWLVTLRLSNARARTALDAVCDMAGCRWSLKGPTLVVTATTRPPAGQEGQGLVDRVLKTPLSGAQWNLRGVAIKDVLKRLSDEAGIDVVVEAEQLTRVVTADLRGRPAVDAVTTIATALGLDGHNMSGRVEPGRNRLEMRFERTRTAPPPAAPPPSRVHEFNEPGIRPPTVVSTVKPTYTQPAMDAKIEGTVVVSAVVGETGAVEDARVVTPLSPDLDGQAVLAARQWRFTPAQKDGKPVAVRITLELTFTLR